MQRVCTADSCADSCADSYQLSAEKLGTWELERFGSSRSLPMDVLVGIVADFFCYSSQLVERGGEEEFTADV